ncbi:MAG: sigma-54-dependent Fis family transcriptional regulator [Acidobacteria bacterium]|nr:sigma-54-dependent Fis family transcriptional regulator [Acidobacteriota bacterium]MBI3427033.1 sigma-54-dependent Fis family transcriptional regulator [Acidobacteriota bacterium]
MSVFHHPQLLSTFLREVQALALTSTASLEQLLATIAPQLGALRAGIWSKEGGNELLCRTWYLPMHPARRAALKALKQLPERRLIQEALQWRATSPLQRGLLHGALAEWLVLVPVHTGPQSVLGMLSLVFQETDRLVPESVLAGLQLLAALLAEKHWPPEPVLAPGFDNDTLRVELSRHYDFSGLLGNSQGMRQVYEQIAQVACAKTTVLIGGESGTGKELVAQALHRNSPRIDGPYLKVNCGALSDNLIESELFGHVRGAFTDAHTDKPGRFELAHGGTLLLDEIGELTTHAQVRLLRVLESGECERLGATDIIQTDVRVIAATNRDLSAEVAAGRFRADLFYRLNLFPITIPPLRERSEDIPVLAAQFLGEFARQHKKALKGFTPHALEMLTSYDWPGNVRELQNAVERAVVVATGKAIQPHELPAAVQTASTAGLTANYNLTAAVEAYERDLICAALTTTRGKRAPAAELLGISERLLAYKLKKYLINPTLYSG